jgi:hypothetical protein
MSRSWAPPGMKTPIRSRLPSDILKDAMGTTKMFEDYQISGNIVMTVILIILKRGMILYKIGLRGIGETESVVESSSGYTA